MNAFANPLSEISSVSRSFPFRRLFACALIVWCQILLPTESLAQTGREWTQELSLEEGWNAVWLEVDPLDDGKLKSPEDVFTNSAIKMVASFFQSSGPVEFLESPEENPFNEDQWAVWYRSDPAGRSNLSAVSGNRAYLIKTVGPVSMSITGQVSYHRYQWVADSYNFAGFGMKAGSEPTFAQFFAPAAKAHPPGQIFKLAAGNWVGVNPNDPMEAGTAYWVFVDGASQYQGPFQIDFHGVDQLEYGFEVRNQEVLFFNETKNVTSFRVDRVNSAPDDFNLIHVVRDPIAQTETEGAAINGFEIADVGSQQSAVETFRLNRTWTSQPTDRSQLYRVSQILPGGKETYQWLPAHGINPDLQPTGSSGSSAGSTTGLWVGDLVFHQVSRNATGTLEPVLTGPKARIILHDNGGQVSLLKSVTIMRRRAAGSGEVEPVLVVNPNKIPFFEGIEERGGKLVGKRIETAFYDLPRTNSAADATDQSYETGRVISGGLSPGGQCETGALVLDQWHRSNPFRHAYHPQHGAGYHLVREMTFTIDPASSQAAAKVPNYGKDILIGTFNETIGGLVSGQPPKVVGRFVLRRISTSAELH